MRSEPVTPRGISAPRGAEAESAANGAFGVLLGSDAGRSTASSAPADDVPLAKDADAVAAAAQTGGDDKAAAGDDIETDAEADAGALAQPEGRNPDREARPRDVARVGDPRRDDRVAGAAESVTANGTARGAPLPSAVATATTVPVALGDGGTRRAPPEAGSTEGRSVQLAASRDRDAISGGGRSAVPPALARALAEALQRVSATAGGTADDGAALRLAAVGHRADGSAFVPGSGQGLLTPVPLATAAPAETVPLPARSPEVFAQMAARALVDAASDGRWTVTLRLDPPELGRLDVQLSRDQGALSASFVAATPAARGLIEQALPMLQQQLGSAGISLGDTSVSERDGQARQDAADADAGRNAPGQSAGGGRAAADDPFVPASATARRQEGLFDAWA